MQRHRRGSTGNTWRGISLEDPPREPPAVANHKGGTSDIIKGSKGQKVSFDDDDLSDGVG